jgi:hypothetical protein
MRKGIYVGVKDCLEVLRQYKEAGNSAAQIKSQEYNCSRYALWAKFRIILVCSLVSGYCDVYGLQTLFKRTIFKILNACVFAFKGRWSDCKWNIITAASLHFEWTEGDINGRSCSFFACFVIISWAVTEWILQSEIRHRWRQPQGRTQWPWK